jgi:hypothetical protein
LNFSLVGGQLEAKTDQKHTGCFFQPLHHGRIGTQRSASTVVSITTMTL